jgi:hypothetical protein
MWAMYGRLTTLTASCLTFYHLTFLNDALVSFHKNAIELSIEFNMLRRGGVSNFYEFKSTVIFIAIIF